MTSHNIMYYLLAMSNPDKGRCEFMRVLGERPQELWLHNLMA